MKFVIKHFTSGEYVVASFFARCPDNTQALLGTLRMDFPTWAALRLLFDGSDYVHFEGK
jgi:hypothetical protein